MRLGWIDPAKVAFVRPGETAAVGLDPLTDSEAAPVVIKIPLSEDTYYLVENRHPVRSNANPTAPYFLDAAFDIGKARVFVDAARNVAIILLEKVGRSYDVLVTTAILAPEGTPGTGASCAPMEVGSLFLASGSEDGLVSRECPDTVDSPVDLISVKQS